MKTLRKSLIDQINKTVDGNQTLGADNIADDIIENVLKNTVTKLDLADAQFIGYYFGKREPSIIAMVESMALTQEEWETWKANYPNAYLKENEIAEIDEYFGKH